MFKADQPCMCIDVQHRCFCSRVLPHGLTKAKPPQSIGQNWRQNTPPVKPKTKPPSTYATPPKPHLSPLYMAYSSDAQKITNTGHTIQISYAEGSTIEVDGEKFMLKTNALPHPQRKPHQWQKLPNGVAFGACQRGWRIGRGRRDVHRGQRQF
jgi:hypothetical protein